ncbi:MAG: polysaccharide deacetylase family protein [Anaerolineae bacterium]|nr:polysaccharide deacetylase family protein [Anaerolineae bacterium]
MGITACQPSPAVNPAAAPTPADAVVFVTTTPEVQPVLAAQTEMLEPLDTPSPTATSTRIPASPTATVTPLPNLPGNLLGSVLVLEYHLIGTPGGRWQRTPDKFREDMNRLHELGYTPANIIDLTLGFPDLPPGTKPVVLTFDDSDISHFRMLPDGSIDPDSAVGILDALHRQYPDAWPQRGTFYVLQDVDAPERILFGQPELADEKLRWLIDQGFEVASHTISHFDLAAGTDEQVQWQLAVSQRQLESRLPGYQVRSLSLPFGSYPQNEALLAQGVWEEQPYSYANAVMVAGGAAPSPYSPEFDPYHIPRVQAIQNEIDYWLGYFEQNPELYYVSE